MMSEEKDLNYEESNEDGEVLSADKIKKLREDLKQCRQEKQEYLTGWQRSQADFINFRRRQEEQMAEWSKMTGEGLLKDILPVLDTFESLEKHGQADIKEVRKQMLGILKKHGLEPIKSDGEKFDHNFHEAVQQVEGEEDKVVETVQTGYMLNGKAIRTAKVKVGKGK